MYSGRWEGNISMEIPSDVTFLDDDNPLNETDYVSFTAPPGYFQYKRIEDSLENIKNQITEKNRFWISGSAISNTGLYSTDLYDSVYYRTPFSNQDEKRKTGKAYFFGLAGFTLNVSHKVFRKDGMTYLKRQVIDKIDSTSKGIQRKGHIEYLKLPFSVSELPENQSYNEADPKRTIYFPISKKQYTTLLYLLGAPGILFLLWYAFVVFILPIRILEYIATGNAFSKKMIRSLYIISFTFIGTVLFNTLLPYIIRAAISVEIPKEFKLSWFISLKEQWVLLIISLFVFALARAFRKGYNLQQEQELTI
jgi:hypothetical protein